MTFGTMSSKAVIRDVGRVLELPFMLCDKLSKLIPLKPTNPEFGRRDEGAAADSGIA